MFVLKMGSEITKTFQFSVSPMDLWMKYICYNEYIHPVVC